MMYNNGFANGSFFSVTLLSGFSSDEFINYFNDRDVFVEFAQNDLNARQSSNYLLWSSCFDAIYAANSIIEGVTTSSSLSVDIKKQLEGEAKFVRAFTYFYLVNLFGNVPLIITTNYTANKSAHRQSVSNVYDQIIKDLLDAKALLNEGLVLGEKNRPNKIAANSLLARCYLYRGEWNKAIDESSIVLNDNRYQLETDLTKTFLANSKEAIWQMMHPLYLDATNEGSIFTLSYTPSFSTPASITTNLLNSFETDDLRLNNWVSSYSDEVDTYYYPSKYKNVYTGMSHTNVEYSMVLRLAEQFLIRAEARARNNDLSGAIDDIDVIRKRAGLSLIINSNPGISQSDLLLAIEQERKVEFFAEWGHRWLDLKRNDRANSVLSYKSFWDQNDVLYPVPEQEILADPNLKPQNNGY